jgi:hypothetical protein
MKDAPARAFILAHRTRQRRHTSHLSVFCVSVSVRHTMMRRYDVAASTMVAALRAFERREFTIELTPQRATEGASKWPTKLTSLHTVHKTRET